MTSKVARRGRKEALKVDQVIDALRRSRGLQKYAAQILNCHRHTIANMAKRHPEVQAVLEEERESTIDTAEAKLLEAINRGEFPAIAFYLKCQARHRGYVERRSTELVQVTPDMLERMTSEQLRKIADGEPLVLVLASGQAASSGAQE